jgi:hypothetical protein
MRILPIKPMMRVLFNLVIIVSRLENFEVWWFALDEKPGMGTILCRKTQPDKIGIIKLGYPRLPRNINKKHISRISLRM